MGNMSSNGVTRLGIVSSPLVAARLADLADWVVTKKIDGAFCGVVDGVLNGLPIASVLRRVPLGLLVPDPLLGFLVGQQSTQAGRLLTMLVIVS